VPTLGGPEGPWAVASSSAPGGHLCNDPCHRGRHCPLAGRRKAARDEWTARCTCPGADVSRRSFERAEAKRGETAAILADVDLSDHPDAETIERRLRTAFEAHGEQLPRNLTGISRVVAAGTGRRGTRSARLLGLGVRAAARGVRWAWQPGADAKDRRALRHMYVSFGAPIGIAILLTAGAARASGWRRLPWAVIALLMWLFTTRSVAIGALVATVVRTENRPPPPPEAQALRPETGRPYRSDADRCCCQEEGAQPHCTCCSTGPSPR
jgi:hypothetical protein